MTPKIPISDLLAHRDGEHMDPQISAEIEADAESREHLKALREIKHTLNELPGIEPPEHVWRDIERSQGLRGAKGPHRLRMTERYRWANLATAATVFFAAALSILWWNPVEGPQRTAINLRTPSLKLHSDRSAYRPSRSAR